MSVERLLQLGTATMAALGATLLQLGSDDMSLAYIATFVAVTSVVFTDWLAWFRLHRYFANTAALFAVSYSAIQFIVPSSDEQLFVIANLLIYLQIILLYQLKNQRVYWHLCVLSLLQVVVAAALNLQVEFGFLLVAYMYIGLATMTLLFLHQANLRFGAASPHIAQREPNSMIAGTPEISAAHDLLSVHPPRQAGGTLIDLVSTNALNPAGQMMNWQLVRQVFRLGLITLLVTVVIFFLTPRLGSSRLRTGENNGSTVVGFNEGVHLNNITSIRDNPELVMTVHFTNLHDGRPYRLHGEPYFHGAVLNTYASPQGEWKTSPVALHQWQGLAEFALPLHGVRQSVQLKTVTSVSSPLFSVQPLYRLASTPPEILRRLDTGKLALAAAEEYSVWSNLHYELQTTAFRSGKQRAVTPHALTKMAASHRELLDRELEACRQFDANAFPWLSALAKKTINDSGVDTTERASVARALERHFHVSNQYRYSYDLTAPRSAVDPVEHFVAETKTGHCEYFASALALMLRSQNIPSRLVIGYHGGDFNRVGKYYKVRQRNTHAWVEAYLRPQDLSPSHLDEDEIATGGAWLRLDPTPAEDMAPETTIRTTVIAQINQLRDYFQTMWDDYVLGMDPDRQREAIYQPLKAKIADSIWNMLLNPEWWELFGRSFRERLGLTSWKDFRERWFHWRAIPIVMCVGLVAMAVYRGLRRPVAWAWAVIANRWQRWRSRRRQLRRWRVDFYVRLERVLDGAGIRRDANTTQREFARIAAAQLQSRGSAVAERPIQITEAFYRVRFGGESLDETEQRSVEEALKQLELGLASFKLADI